MKGLFRATWRAAGIASIVAILLTCVLSYYSYEILLSPARLAAITGPQEGYYWTVSQYQLFFERLETEILLFSTGTETNTNKISLYHQILKSKFNVLSQPSELTEFFYDIHKYYEAVIHLGSFMQQLDSNLSIFKNNKNMASEILMQFEDARKIVLEISNEVHLAELHLREEMIEDFYQKRHLLYASGLLLWLFFVAWVGVLSFNIRRSWKLIQRQEESIAAERCATLAVQDAINTKNAFLGMISHEIRTPLHTITSSIDLLSLKKYSDKDRQIIHRMVVASRHLVAQMKDLTDYARIDAGKMELRKESFDPHELAQYIIEEQIDAAESKGLALILEKDGLVGEVWSDPYRISQVAGNIIENAIKYTETGIIFIRFFRSTVSPCDLEISVADTGIGIDKKNLPVLFQPFTQLDQSSARRYEGTGLGLAIVKGIVECLGGSIEVDSQLGKGSCFKITIPVEPIESVSPNECNDDDRELAEGRVLVVDDHTEIQDSFREMLEQMGYVVNVSPDGYDAIKQLMATRFDLVLLDINMPEKDGYVVAKELRGTTGPNQTVPIIGISAFSPSQNNTEASITFDDYLTKPVRYDNLRVALIKVLNRSRSTLS